MPLPTLKKGDSNNCVKYLQYGLHIMCYKINGIDGIFGNGTHQAVIGFQKSQNLDADGIVGTKTWNSLNCEILSIQKQLKNKGFNPGSLDGIAGQNTYNAIIEFQKENNLTADGMVGEKTQSILFDSGYDETKQPLLQKGSNDKNAIKNLQNLLIKKGYSCGSSGADGIFGDGTYKAVVSLQKDYHLAVDGIVGIATWGALNSDFTPNSESSNTEEKNEVNEIPKNLGDVCTGKASENLIYFIKHNEGYAPSIYKDVVGVRTIGYGLTGQEIEGLNEITEEKATQLLAKYVNEKYFCEVLKIVQSKGVKNPLQREIDAFTSFAYNLGVGSFRNSTLLKKYAAGERGNSINNEFSRWVYAGKKKYPGLVKRRQLEWQIFSGSKESTPGYNCKPNISIIDANGKPYKRMTENNGYGAKPY